MKPILIIATVLLALIAGYYQFFSSSHHYRRITGHAVDHFSAVVNRKDRAQISAELQTLLAPDAHIRLSVNFFSISQQGAPAVQEFDKAAFIGFVDNLLYSMGNYGYQAHVQRLNLHSDRQSAAITVDSTGWADGLSYFSGTSVNMRFSADSQCSMEAAYAGETVTLKQVDCQLQLRTVPKPGEESKFRDPQMLMQLLK